MIKVKAFAKINLTLDITGKDDNGYHTLSMIMQSVSLHDTITIKCADSEGIEITSSNKRLPNDSRNLAYKAAELFFSKTGISAGISIDIKKSIPISAGLAGGSADAAGVLVGLNSLFETELSEKELCEYGSLIGSDIPFCIVGGTALCEGYGEKITKLTPLAQCYILIAKPNAGMSTQKAYSLFDESDVSGPIINNDKAIESINNNDIDSLCIYLGNKLQPVTEKEVESVKQIASSMLLRGAKNAIMTGSGTAVFGIFENRLTAEKCLKQIAKDNISYIVTPVNTGTEIVKE